MRSLHFIFSAGIVLPYALTTPPNGWLLCDGQALAPGTADHLRAELIAAGNPYGVSGSDPRVPDMRGRVPGGRDNMGGTAASRLTNTGTGNPGINGSTLGAAGGTDRHTLAESQIPAHVHGPSTATVTNFIGNATAGSGGSLSTTIAGGLASVGVTGSTGGGAAHPNAQPTLILNYIIKT